MDSNDSDRRPPKKTAPKKTAKAALLDSQIVTNLRRQIEDRWPSLGRGLTSLIQVSREKLDDIYSSAAQVIAEHKEAFEDRLAERKAGKRTATRDPEPVNVPARSKRRSVKNGRVRGSASRPAKNPRRSSAKPSS